MAIQNKFPVQKVLNLGFLGKGWDTGAEIAFSGLTFGQTQELASVNLDDSPEKAAETTKFILGFLEEHFLQGKAWNGTALVDLTEDDLKELPVEVINKAVELLAGAPNPKS